MATTNKIPDAVRAAAAGMLAPFGVDLEKILAAEPKIEQAEVRSCQSPMSKQSTD